MKTIFIACIFVFLYLLLTHSSITEYVNKKISAPSNNNDSKFPNGPGSQKRLEKITIIHNVDATKVWAGGLYEGEKLRAATASYIQRLREFWPGPLDTANTTFVCYSK